MKKVVSLILAVLVATMLSTQVFASISATSGDILVYPESGFEVTLYADRASAEQDVEDTLNAAYADISGKTVKYFDSSLDPNEFEIVLLFDARPVGQASAPDYFEVKAGLNSGDKVRVFHWEDNEIWKEVSCEANGANVKIKGVTTFSAFVVLKSTSSSSGTSPATGDQMIAVYGVGALVFTAAAILLLRKRENA